MRTSEVLIAAKAKIGTPERPNPPCPACGTPMVYQPAETVGTADSPYGTKRMPPMWGCDDCGESYRCEREDWQYPDSRGEPNHWDREEDDGA